MGDLSTSTLEFLHSVTQGSLFTYYFLTEGVRQSPDYHALDETQLTQLLQTLQDRYLQFRKSEEPDEADTEDDLVQPILDGLGFSYLRQKKPGIGIRAERPDYLLLESESIRQQALKDKARQFQLGISILEAKRLERPLDHRGEPQDVSDPGTPSSQILRYLSSAEVESNGRILWGILTNGRLWRLYYQKAKSRVEGYLEFDLDPILNPEGLFQLSERKRLEAFKLFYLFLRRDAFIQTMERPDRTFLEFALEEGKNYEERVTEDLKQKIFEDIFIFLAHGFVEDAERQVSIDRVFLDEVYRNVLTLLYRLLFILYAEDRDLLPVRDPRYVNYSLRKLRGEIERRLDEQDAFSLRATSYWDRLKSLFRIVSKGDPSLNVPVYNGGLFDSQAHPFLEQRAISDHWLAKALDLLSRDYSDPQHPRHINYRDLGVRQLGSIYEGLLEFKLHIVEEDLVVVKEKGKERYLAKADATDKRVLTEIKEGELFIANDKSERKATGSYYTPDYIVQYIVENTLGPLVQRIEDDFQKEIEGLKALKGQGARWKTVELAEKHDPAMKVLELKVLDPAMGSGHFLVGAVDCVADRIIELLEQHNGQTYFGEEPYESPLYQQIETIRQQIRASAAEQGVQLDESKLEDKHIVKRMVMKRCIYGVDLNEMAVELAKVSLWLNSFTIGAPLSFLDHHLKCGNSLIGALDVKEHVIETSSRYQDFLRAVSNYLVVNQLTDATFRDVEESHQLYEEAETWLQPFKQRFDAALAAQQFLEFSKEMKERLDAYVFDSSEPVTGRPRDEFQARVDQAVQAAVDEALRIAREKGFFHWELEFPEVWYDKGRRRDNPGFDVVIGNPPWGALLDEAALSFLGRAFEAHGWNDSYAFFLQCGVNLTRNGSLFGMIVPSSWLTVAIYKAVREWLFAHGEFSHIGYLYRVFEEVNLDEVLFIYQNGVEGLEAQVLIAQPDISPTKRLRTLASTGWYRQYETENAVWKADPDKRIDVLVDPQARAIVTKVRNYSLPLEGSFGVGIGIQAYCQPKHTRAQIEKRIYHSTTKRDHTYMLCLSGNDVGRYEIHPEQAEYLSVGDWLYFVPDPDVFRESRILCQQVIWKTLKTCLVEQNDLAHYNSIFHVWRPKGHYSLEFAAALLNARLMAWVFPLMSNKTFGEKFPKLSHGDLSSLPIRRIFFTTPPEERQRLVEQLKELYSNVFREARSH